MEVTKMSSSISSATNPSKLENLPEELKTDILLRLPKKDLSRMMCTAKPWRQLITRNCITKIAPFTTHIAELEDALLLRLEEKEEPSNRVTHGGKVLLLTRVTDTTYPDLIALLKWCSNIMQCDVTFSVEKLIDYCNGLFLFCHKGGNPETLRVNFYYYYVINPLTRQCIAIYKPNAGTKMYSYAALAYHPSESSFFKIVQFRRTGYIKVFSSESGSWEILRYELPEQVTEAKWERKSVYLRGAVYRVSNSGHLVKFLVNAQESVGDQAKAIELPAGCKLPRANMCVGVKNNEIVLALSEGHFLRIWGLKESYGGEECSSYWDLQHEVENLFILRISSLCRLVAIHPHLESVYFMSRCNMCCYCYDARRVDHRNLKVRSAEFNWDFAFAFPLFECTVPFTCCLRKRFPGIFKWIAIPESCRRLEADLPRGV
ncbi:hypothetical protein L6164_023348 [Bauhinia variegata]|uniref:Uncharacterized protein n=1 Tax=Bauhinia variegata TaxID=167791 RepID=A0ACB9MIA0_BAUVA|nr:hypothetical protein L6164_023348 [Bauhinia variegata]